MKKYLLLIIMMLFICTGCGVTYTVEINDDMSAKEQLMALENNEFFSQYEHSSKGRVIGFLLEPYLEQLNNNNYVANAYIPPTNSGGGALVDKKYKTVEDLFKNTILTSVYTDKVEYEEKGNKVTIKAKGNFSHSTQDQSRIPVDTAKIKIKLPFKVSDSNADKVSGDTYVWEFNENSKERELYITFDKTKIDTPTNSFPFILIGIAVIMVIVGFVVYNIVMKRRENINKI